MRAKMLKLLRDKPRTVQYIADSRGFWEWLFNINMHKLVLKDVVSQPTPRQLPCVVMCILEFEDTDWAYGTTIPEVSTKAMLLQDVLPVTDALDDYPTGVLCQATAVALGV